MTEGLPVSETHLLEALQRISSATPIANAESLRTLLSYLVRQSIDRPADAIKEAQIAAAVFNKSEAFDPRQDSTVRVQTSRLRSKLLDYYRGEGATDPWILDVPKGSYAISMRRREPAADPPTPAVIPAEPVPMSPWLYAGAGFAAGALSAWLAIQSIHAL